MSIMLHVNVLMHLRRLQLIHCSSIDGRRKVQPGLGHRVEFSYIVLCQTKNLPARFRLLWHTFTLS